MTKATARQTDESFTHRVAIRAHELIVDEPEADGGNDRGPSPEELLAASLASCAAITVEMYAKRKGWDVAPVEVECRYSRPSRGQPSVFELVLRVPDTCSEEQLERLAAIAGKCPVHRTLEGEVVVRRRVEPTEPRPGPER